MQKLVIKDLGKKILKWRRAVAIDSIILLFLLSGFVLGGANIVKELEEIAFIDRICENFIMYNIISIFMVYMTNYIVINYSCKCRLIHMLIITFISCVFKIVFYIINISFLNIFFDFIYLIICAKYLKGSIKKTIKLSLIISLSQVLLGIVYNIFLYEILSKHISIYLLLNLNLYIIIYNIYKGDENICGDVCSSGESQAGSTQSQGSFLAWLKFHIILLKELPLILRKVIQEAKKSKKNVNALNIIYIVLYIAWNLFTVWIVYRMARGEDKTIEMTLVLIAFIVNKTTFGKPLHLPQKVCFIASLIVFYMLSKSIPGTSLSVLLPIMIGVSLAMISSIIQELIFTEIRLSLRDKILKETGSSPTEETIYAICKSKGFKDDKASDISKTVFTYLHHSQYETAELVCCDNRTVTRRINEFLKTR